MKIECICPLRAGKPRHAAGDTVRFRPQLDFRAALAARNAIAVMKLEDPDAGLADIMAMLTEHYLLSGIESWSVVDADGKAVPVTKPAIREYLLSKPDVAMTAGDEADGLYSEAVMRPLVKMANDSSESMPTELPTSVQTNGSANGPKTPSKRSSTSTTRTGDTVTTHSSLGGVSS